MLLLCINIIRGGEWYLEKIEISEAFLISLVFAWFVLTFFESRNFLPKSLGLGFLTRVSASRRVSDFTIRHPYYYKHPMNNPRFVN